MGRHALSSPSAREKHPKHFIKERLFPLKRFASKGAETFSRSIQEQEPSSSTLIDTKVDSNTVTNAS